MTLRRCGRLADVWRGEMCRVEHGRHGVLLVRLEDRLVAYEDRCPHQAVALSDGALEGGVLRCAAHGWTFDAATGRGLNPTGVELRPVDVQVEGGEIYVDVDDAREALR